MNVNLIVAVAENGVIGKEGDLPWRLSSDLKHFRKITLGHTVIMGRKTRESIPKALPERRMLVISRTEGYKAEESETFTSLGDALKACIGEDEVFIIGGGTIYEKALELNIVDRIYLTQVHTKVEGDVFFRIPDMSKWRTESKERFEADEKNAFAFSFITLERDRE